jgi:hypothetical protein
LSLRGEARITVRLIPREARVSRVINLYIMLRSGNVGNHDVTEVVGKVLDCSRRCPNELKYSWQAYDLREVTCMK